MSKRVLVTGASGYMAGHVIAELREHGYQVRGTARKPVDGLDDVVQADLSRDHGWAAAVDGCDYVLHVASPFPSSMPRTPDEVIKPAVDGTLRVLKAAKNVGVERVVMTSSLVAVSCGHPNGPVRTEADWAVVDRCTPYTKSKTLAELAAWDFAGEHGLDLVTLCPGMVFGPVLSPKLGTSIEVVRRLLNHDVPASPPMGFAVVDVRDVATAHRLALESHAASGNRYIVAGEHMWLKDIAKVLADEFNPLGYRVPTGGIPEWLGRVIAWFDPTVRTALDHFGRHELVSSEKAERDLGWRGRPARESIVATGYSLIEHGLAPNPARRKEAVAAA
jgi:dihydroflavonol-4-reductase